MTPQVFNAFNELCAQIGSSARKDDRRNVGIPTIQQIKSRIESAEKSLEQTLWMPMAILYHRGEGSPLFNAFVDQFFKGDYPMSLGFFDTVEESSEQDPQHASDAHFST